MFQVQKVLENKLINWVSFHSQYSFLSPLFHHDVVRLFKQSIQTKPIYPYVHAFYMWPYCESVVIGNSSQVVIGQSKRSRTQVYSGKKALSGPQGKWLPIYLARKNQNQYSGFSLS